MTFKGTSEALNHIARVASASTRPHANGRIDLIPDNAREPEEYYNTIRDQYLAMNERFKGLQARLTEIKTAMRQTLPFEQYRALSQERDALAEQYKTLQPELVKLRADVRLTGKDAWAITFYGIAKRVLDSETFKKVDREVELLLGRPIAEVAKGEAEWSDQTRESKQKGDRRNQSRRNMRAKMIKRAALAERDASA